MRKLLNLFGRRRDRLERDLDRELRDHVDRRVADLVDRGFSVVDARRRAIIELGGVAQVQEVVRETWTWRAVQETIRDLRYGARALRRTPGFTATAVLSLALGIGANTAIFSILHALVLRSLPVSDPGQLVVVSRNQLSLPYPLFRHFQDHSRTLDGVVAFRSAPWRVTDAAGSTERISGVLVSGSYFRVLGVAPILGTAITDEDDRTPGSGGPRGPVAVLSHGFWMRHFAGQRSVIGSRMLVNGHPFTVVGIAPPAFNGTEVGESPDVFASMMMQDVLLPGLGNAVSLALSQRRNNWLRIIGRVKADSDVRQAEAELTTLLSGFNKEILESGETLTESQRRNLAGQQITLLAGHAGISSLRQQYSKPLWVLMTVMGLVLLIACANIANLSLSRASARRQEIAIRLGLGASRGRLVSQLLTESLLLALAGGLSGLLFARWLRDLLMTYLPLGQRLSVPLDRDVMLFTLTLAAGAALLFGLVPAFQSTKLDVTPALKGAGTSSRSSRALFRKGLVIAQVSLSLVVILASALFLRSLQNLIGVDTGFARENILVASVDVSADRFTQFYPRLLEEVKSLPGVVAAGLADTAPLGTSTGWNIHIPGYVPVPNEPRASPWVVFVSPGYVETMKLPLVLGRDFEQRDLTTPANVMIVNETFARHYFSGMNPVGRRVGLSPGVFDVEIIGVARDTKYRGLREDPMRTVYVPFRPGPWASGMVVHLRTAGDPSTLASALRERVRALDPGATIFNIRTVEDEIDRTLLRERLVATMTALFGVLALALAAVGLYGLLSYGVAQRTREFGIRIAIGAKADAIRRLVLGEAAWLVGIGTILGLVAAWSLGRVVTGMLFGIEATDVTSAVVAVAVLSACALIAAWIPARRASNVDPTIALRSQ